LNAGSAGGFSGKKKRVYYSFTNYTTPELPIHLKLKKEISSISKPKVDFKVKTSNQTSFYTSKDGTKIPMMITYKKRRIEW
jgi:prolyl oligopeptidase